MTPAGVVSGSKSSVSGLKGFKKLAERGFGARAVKESGKELSILSGKLKKMAESHGYKSSIRSDGGVTVSIPLASKGKISGYKTFTARTMSQMKEVLGY